MNPWFRDVLTIGISLVSLLLSAYAVWVSQFNHGRLRMTRPTLLCLKREFPGGIPKIFLRTCLFTTGNKGRVIENMFLRVRQAHEAFTFDFWGHTEGGKLTLGSGLAVGPTGVASDHHFNPRQGSVELLYVDGDYEVEVFASVIGVKQPELLQRIRFSIEGAQSAELIQIPTRELYLFLNADTGSYTGSVRHENRARDGSAPVGIDRHEVLTAVFADALLHHVPDPEAVEESPSREDWT